MKLSIIQLLVSTILHLIAFHGVCHASETLVLDSSASSGAVVAFSFSASKTNVSEEKVAVNASQFCLGPNGYYVFENRDREWFSGEIGDTNMPTHIARMNGHDFSHAAVSSDGNWIAWVSKDPKPLVRVTSKKRNHDDETFAVVVNGMVGGVAWSPTMSQIAMYISRSSSTGYEVYLMDYVSNYWKLEQIAPPSLPTRLNIGRPDPPVWSPDGKHLLAEAAYASQTIRNPFTIINVSSKQCFPSVSGVWSADSGGIQYLTFQTKSTKGWRAAVTTEQVETRVKQQVELLPEIPLKVWVIRPSPDGKKVAYTSDGVASVIFVDDGRIMRLSGADIHTKLEWVVSSRK